MSDRRRILIIALGATLAGALIGVAIPLALGGGPRQMADIDWHPPATVLEATQMPEPGVTAVAAQAETADANAAASTPTATAMPAQAAATSMPAATMIPSRAAATSTPGVEASPTSEPAATVEPPSPAGASTTDGAIAAPQIHVTDTVKLHIAPDLSSLTVGLGLVGQTYTVTARTSDAAWLELCCVSEQRVWVASEAVTITGSLANVPHN
jgi:hypothetical protein